MSEVTHCRDFLLVCEKIFLLSFTESRCLRLSFFAF
jgi:hypothetical protein